MTSSLCLTIISKHKLHTFGSIPDSALMELFACADTMQVPHHFLWIPWIYAVTWRPHHGPIQSSNHPRLATPQKVKDIQSFLGFCQFYCHFIYGYSKIHSFWLHILPTRVPLAFSNEGHSCLWSTEKAFTTALVLTIGSQTLKLQWDWCLPNALATVLPHDSQWRIAPHCIPLPDPFCPRNSIQCPWTKSYSQFLKLSNDGTLPEGSGLPLMWSLITNCIFSMTKIVMHWPSMVGPNTFLVSPGNPFLSGKLRTKPDALTRWWDIYLKEGIVTMPGSIHRTTASITSKHWHCPPRLPPYQSQFLHGYLIMDAERLHSDIQSQLWEDPISTEHLNNQSDPKWPLIPMVLLCHLGCIYSELWQSPNYMLSSTAQTIPCRSFQSDKTLHQVHMQYYWSRLQSTSGYCKSCTICSLHQTCVPQTLQTSQAISNSQQALEFHIHGFIESSFHLWLTLI